MIKTKLDVKDYCHKCPKFSAEMTHQYIYAPGGSIEQIHCITITCDYADLCSFLRREIENNESK